MGCDIHIIAEVNDNGCWRINTDKVFKNTWYEEYKKWIKRAKEDGNKQEVKRIEDNFLSESEFITHPSDNRNYDWFSILADVRNGYGFAGIKTGEGFNIISQPRGIPEDASDEWQEECNEWNGDFHSHSYLTIEDFESFNWDQITMKRGYIILDQYKELRNTNKSPKIWSGGVSGGNIITIDEDEADKHIKNSNPEYEGKEIYVNYHWSVNYREHFKYNLENLLPPLKQLRDKYGDARIVFAFDN